MVWLGNFLWGRKFTANSTELSVIKRETFDKDAILDSILFLIYINDLPERSLVLSSSMQWS